MGAISKSSVKMEKEVKQILVFFDRIAEEDLNHLMLYGIEGVHYKKREINTTFENKKTIIDGRRTFSRCSS